jgi:hypothetical protein
MTGRTKKRKRKGTVGWTRRTKQVNTILQTVAGRTQEQAQNTLDINPLSHEANGNGQAISCMGNMLLCAAALTVLLAISRVEQNPGPGVEAENRLQVLRSGCERNLKSGAQCNMCGRWFHNSCGNIKMADSGKWICGRCKWDRKTHAPSEEPSC